MSVPPSLAGPLGRDGQPPGFGTDPVRDGIREVLVGAFIVAIGVGAFVDVRIIGRILLTEAMLLVALPFLLFVDGPRLNRRGWLVVCLALAWLANLVVTDLVRSTPSSDLLRGWARIALIVTSFVALWRLLDRDSRFLLFLSAFGLGTMIDTFTRHVEPQLFWKFGGAWGMFCATVGLLLLRQTLRLDRSDGSLGGTTLHLAAVACVFSIASVAMNSRSFAATALLASIMLLSCSRDRSRAAFRTHLLERPWRAALVGIVVAYCIGWAFTLAADSGWLGEETRDRLRMQSLHAFDPVLGLLLGGRGELFASVRAVLDAPIVGHGSWAKSVTYFEILLDSLRKYSSPEMVAMAEYNGPRSEYLIPTHSHVLGAWVEAGLFGGAFWLYVQLLLTKGLVDVTRSTTPIGLAFVAMFAAQTWNLWFSPLGAESRVYWAIMLIAACRACYRPPRQDDGP